MGDQAAPAHDRSPATDPAAHPAPTTAGAVAATPWLAAWTAGVAAPGVRAAPGGRGGSGLATDRPPVRGLRRRRRERDPPGGRGLLMERMPGGFVDTAEGVPTRYAERVSAQTLSDLERFADALLETDANGLRWYYQGECTGFVDDAGRWHPLDFRGIGQFPPPAGAPRGGPATWEEALERHRASVGAEIEHLADARQAAARLRGSGGGLR